MVDFGSILGKGKKLFGIKSSGGIYGRCEDCNARAYLFKYVDESNEIWLLCEPCVTSFVKDEEEK